MQQRDVLRLAFNNDAGRYDRTRPRYPHELFDDLADELDLVAGSSVFEIGCGTGQATLHMAARGWAVDAVDLGDNLAEYAATRVGAFPDASVRALSFDDMELPTKRYAAVTAFTSFHWLDPATRVERAASLLGEEGALVIVDTHHVHGSDPFFDRAQECYVRWDPDAKPGFRLPSGAGVEVDVSEFEGVFDDIAVHTYEAEILYTTAQYIDLLRTFSGHATMHPENQARLFGCLSALIEAQGGSVHKPYVFSMVVARR